MSDTAIIQLDRARVALAECKTVMEAKQIADVAEAARVYLERTNASVETVNRAVEIRALAERQMGEFLREMPKATGAMGIGTSAVPDGNRTKTLSSLGITKKQSARAQRLAAMPAAEFHERIELVKASGERLSIAKVAGDTPAPTEKWVAPSTAMFVARGAVTQLSNIPLSDSERTNALRYVITWCMKQLNETQSENPSDS